MSVPGSRIRRCNSAARHADGDFVLYWMTAFRRLRWNFALERARDHAASLAKPLVVLEALRLGYDRASDRLHRFVLDGMEDNLALANRLPILYSPYLERRAGDGGGLLRALAQNAAVVVTDDYPGFFIPRMIAAAAEKIDVRLEAVDSNGLYPLAATDKVFSRAYDLRRHLQSELPPHLELMPSERPFADSRMPKLERLPGRITERWPMVSAEELKGLDLGALGGLDHDVQPTGQRGGSAAAGAVLSRFLDDRLRRYSDDRLNLDNPAASELSPYLHFGHVSAHEVFAAVAAEELWDPGSLRGSAQGKRSGWWGMSAAAESFLDELVTWRELGFHSAAKVEGYDRYGSLPDWARRTLAEHADDDRDQVYSHEELEGAMTSDPVWNAAQRELLDDGRIHNYLRMLWGKKILEWSPSPEEALQRMLHLNDKYALDGRDPNSISGIFWCLGRYDRAWGPERPIFGKVRYMSSESARRKLTMSDYLARHGEQHRLG